MDDRDRRQIAKANAVKNAAATLNEAMRQAADVGIIVTAEVLQLTTVASWPVPLVEVKCAVEL